MKAKPMTDDEKRGQLKAYWRECDRIRAERQRLEDEHNRKSWRHFDRTGKFLPPSQLPAAPDYPSELQGMSCGAKTRAGTPCKMTSLYGNGRCKLHGGMSTGPRTTEGKRKAAGNGNAPKRKQTP